MIDIELLYFGGCPSWERAWTDLGLALAATGVDATVRLRDIEALSPSELSGFAGSPTLRIDGIDMEGYAGPPVVACRRYESNDGRGWPSAALLHDRLAAATKGAAS